MKIKPWIYHNLFNFKNCLIPNSLIKAHGIKKVTEALEAYTGYEIEIVKNEAYARTTDLQYLASTECTYVAWVRGTKKWKL